MIKTKETEYTLKYTYNALVAYEDRFKRPLLRDVASTSLSALRGLVWAGLIHGNPAHPLTENAVGELIENAIEQGMDLVDIRQEVVTALDEATFMQRLAEKTEARLASLKKAQEKP